MRGYRATEVRARFPKVADGRFMAEGYARRHEYPEEDYFGLGPVSLRSNQTDYSVLTNTFGGRAGVRPTSIVAVGGAIQHLEPRVGSGQDESLPSIDDTFNDKTAPGLSQQPNFVRSSAFLDIDWRRPLNARNGGCTASNSATTPIGISGPTRSGASTSMCASS